jgi:membrane protein implicated in regulation of membrane protease activity
MFGSIGMGYIVYGRKQHKGIALLSGIVLCVFPYFVPNVFLLIIIGIVLMAFPFFFRY